MKSNFYKSLVISYLDKFWIWIGLFFATNLNKVTTAKSVNSHYVNSDKVKFKIRLQNGFGLIVKACSLLPPSPPPHSTYNQGPFLLLARDVCQTRVISTENWNCNGRCWVLAVSCGLVRLSVLSTVAKRDYADYVTSRRNQDELSE